MVTIITQNLEIPKPKKYIDIEEVTTTVDRSIAKDHRKKGKHVIPIAPTEVVKKPKKYLY